MMNNYREGVGSIYLHINCSTCFQAIASGYTIFRIQKLHMKWWPVDLQVAMLHRSRNVSG